MLGEQLDSCGGILDQRPRRAEGVGGIVGGEVLTTSVKRGILLRLMERRTGGEAEQADAHGTASQKSNGTHHDGRSLSGGIKTVLFSPVARKHTRGFPFVIGVLGQLPKVVQECVAFLVRPANARLAGGC